MADMVKLQSVAPITNRISRSQANTASATDSGQSRRLNKGALSTSTVTAMTDGVIKFARYERPADDTASTYRVAQIAHPFPAVPNTATGATGVLAGDRVTLLFRARVSAANVGTSLSIEQVRFIDPGATNTSINFGGFTYTTEWAWYRRTATAAADGISSNVFYLNFSNMPTGYLDIAEVMVVSGEYTGPYCDGDTPGWRWTGTAGNSSSIGYPYTLESIAGPPLAISTVLGSATPVTIGAYAARTLYTAYELDGTMTGQYLTVAGFGGTATSGMIRVQTQNTGTSNVGGRFDTINGTSNQTIYRNIRTAGRHIAWATLNEGLTEGRFNINTAAPVQTLAVTPGDGMINPVSVVLGAGASELKPLVVIAYATEHSAETRARVMAWLSRNYNVPLA